MTASAAIPHFHFCDEVQASGCLAPWLWLLIVLVAVPGLQTASLGVERCTAASERATPHSIRMPLLPQMDALLELRQRLRADPSLPPGTKLTFLPFFIKARGALVGWLVAIQAESWPGCHHRTGRVSPRISRFCSRQTAWPPCKAACSMPNPHVPPLFLCPDFVFLRRLLAWRCGTGPSSTPACLATRALWCATAT